MSNNFLKTVIHYYDKNRVKYFDLVNQIEKIDFLYNHNDIENNIIKLFDKDNKLLIDSRFEYLGSYNNFTKTWIWAWAIPQLPKNTRNISTNLLNYGLNLDNKKMILKNELINSRFQISSLMQLDTHIAVSSYISRTPLIIQLYYTAEISKNFITKKTLDEYLKKTNKKNIIYVKYYLFILDLPTI